ncbi:holo-ACP synthase [Anaeromyxobacter paludicola]|uniref:Holo-[acyl-carrier-protein] synthase n=1 Tax=Anaeromyxobacter paludicola TaxID=2918171 RepID=A0ABN6N520_9BACT|nr:4'-phosphopantetheinyl transferase superfamily protein [Anaeromyxobacter paludicola]BDG07094.1 hypothetical protein AMPC_02070 [Anaeromyxobacter paludicola]
MRREAAAPPVSIGVDVEEIARFRALLPKLAGSQRRLFHPEEHAYCRSQPDPAVHYAGRWCAKEAVVKALSAWRLLVPRQVCILRSSDGRPRVRIDAEGGAEAARRLDVSISHTASVAVAVAAAAPARSRRRGKLA